MCGAGDGSAVKKYCNKNKLQYYYFQNGLYLLQYCIFLKIAAVTFFPRPLLSKDLEASVSKYLNTYCKRCLFQSLSILETSAPRLT